MITTSLYVMAVLYIIAGLNHFRKPRLYLKMIPPYFPKPELLNKLSGVAEIILGLGLLWPDSRVFSAWGLIALLLGVFPANFYMFQQRKNLFKNIPTWLLLVRLPLQMALIAWAYLYT